MVYRFKIVSDEVDNFCREIEIDADASFLELRNAILDSVGFSKDELNSFFLCDDDWEKKEEITLSKHNDGNHLIAELKANKIVFLLGYRAKGFINKFFLQKGYSNSNLSN